MKPFPGMTENSELPWALANYMGLEIELSDYNHWLILHFESKGQKKWFKKELREGRKEAGVEPSFWARFTEWLTGI